MIKCKMLWKIALVFLCALPLAAEAQKTPQQQSNALNEELIYRINFGRADDIKILLDRGANPNALSSTGEYALSIATGRDDSDSTAIVKALLDKGANPNVYDKSNVYPIVSAVINNKTEIVTYLMAKGANIHVKSPNGRTLIDIANANNNKDIVKMIQAQLDKEAEAEAALRSPERFKQIVRQYAFESCLYQYWNFVIGSRQNPDKEQEFNKYSEGAKKDIASLIDQIQKYYPNTATRDLQTLSNDAASKIFTLLDNMVSNGNREAQGVGKPEDADKRCHKITDNDIDFAPSDVKQP